MTQRKTAQTVSLKMKKTFRGEELKHDLNELYIYVHKLIWFCEVVWRATDLVVLTF